MIEPRFARPPLAHSEIKAALKAILVILQSQPQVAFAYLYGSVLDFQRGDQSPLPHDVDVAIYLIQGDWVGVELDMQSEFSRRTSFNPEVFDVHTLNNAPIEAVMEIIKCGKMLFCRDSLQHADFLERISNSYRRLAGILAVAHA